MTMRHDRLARAVIFAAAVFVASTTTARAGTYDLTIGETAIDVSGTEKKGGAYIDGLTAT